MDMMDGVDIMDGMDGRVDDCWLVEDLRGWTGRLKECFAGSRNACGRKK